jgi:hypothetical protein
MHVHSALAIATSDRLAQSAQVQAKNAADASRRVQDLYAAASRLKADSAELEEQNSSDAEASAVALSWGSKTARSVFSTTRQTYVPDTTTPSKEAGSAASPGISFWV